MSGQCLGPILHLAIQDPNCDTLRKSIFLENLIIRCGSPETTIPILTTNIENLNLGLLGVANGMLGNLASSKTMLQLNLLFEEALLGPNHINVATSLANLAIVCGSHGDRATSKRYLERAMKIIEEFYGPDHVKVATILINLGTTCGSLGDHDT
eukprot:PhF_6_TR14251/c0_g1_i1/m.22880